MILAVVGVPHDSGVTHAARAVADTRMRLLSGAL